MAMTATASMTRSRPAEVGRHHRTSTAVRTRQIDLANALAFASSRAAKRQLDSPDQRVDPVLPPPKKPRLAAETQVASPVRQLHRTRQQEDSHAQKHHRQHESHRRHQPNGPAAPAPAPASANAAPKPPTTAIANPSQSRQTTLQQQRQQQDQLPSVSEGKRKKPANGRLKQELQSLRGHHHHHHHHVDTRSQGRKLRSQEATRFKSELAAYFPEYDEVIGNDPKETHFLNSDTPIVVKDFEPGHQQAPHPVADDPARPQPDSAADGVRTYSDRGYTDLFDSQRVDLGLLDTLSHQDIPADDPLPDAIYEPAHKKAERNERSIRNSEKGRARHERDQIIRLLESLQGPDWLRTLGVSGITKSRKREFEPARDHFIKGCQGILKKFRTWVAEEKRLKLEKELAAAAQLDEEHSSGASVQWDREGEGGGDGGGGGGGGGGGAMPKARRPVRLRRALNAEELSDDDASIEAQLHELAAEAAADETRGTRARKAKRNPRRKIASTSTQTAKSTQSAATPATSSFPSFFAKRYQRDAALGKNRRRGRTTPLAWGHPVPDSEEKDFELPPEFQQDVALMLQARRKRRESGEKNEGQGLEVSV